MIVTILAEASQLITNEGNATAAGIWLLTGLGAITALGITGNQILGILVKRRQLNAPPGTTINPQPLIVAMQKEFVQQHEFEAHKKASADAHAKFELGLNNRFTEFSNYEHGRIHDFAKFLETLRAQSEDRLGRLAAVEADVKTLSRTVTNFDGKLDKLIDAAGELRGRAHRSS